MCAWRGQQASVLGWGWGVLSGSSWSLEQDQNISVAVICIYISAIYTHGPTPAYICPRGRHEPAQVLTIKALSAALQQSERRVKRYTTSISTEEQHLS